MWHHFAIVTPLASAVKNVFWLTLVTDMEKKIQTKKKQIIKQNYQNHENVKPVYIRMFLV